MSHIGWLNTLKRKKDGSMADKINNALGFTNMVEDTISEDGKEESVLS